MRSLLQQAHRLEQQSRFTNSVLVLCAWAFDRENVDLTTVTLPRLSTVLSARRHPLAVMAGAAAAVFLVAVFLGEVAGHAPVRETMRQVRPEWFALCLVAQVVAYFGYVFALRETARVDGGPALPFRHAASVVAAGFGAFFSGSAAGGFEVDYWALRHAGVGRPEALRRVLGLGTLEYAVLAPAAMFSAIAILADAGDHVRPSMSWPWLAVFPGVAVAVWATQPDRALRWIDAELDDGRFRRGAGHAIAGLSVVRRLVQQPRAHGMAFVGTAMYWFGEILCLWAALMAFGAQVQVPILIVGFATGYVLTRRGLPAGGAGVAEVALTLALVGLHVPFAAALLGVFSYRFFNFWLALVPAFAARGTMRAIRAAPVEA
jgi:uncharacterized membrane protein YbhN (UPF0104 family)